jgi:hypothetical protein
MSVGVCSFIEGYVWPITTLRADIAHAFHLDSRPLFYRDEFPREMVESILDLHNLKGDVAKAAKQIKTMEQSLQIITQDISSMFLILQRRLTKFDPFDFQEMLISVLYRLLNLPTLSKLALETEVNQQYIHSLGSLAFTSTLLFTYLPAKKMAFRLLTRRLRSALVHMSPASVRIPALLWALFMVGISTLHDTHVTWLLPWIKLTTSSLGIENWPDAEAHLRQYPWIDSFHAEPGQKLWIMMSAGQRCTDIFLGKDQSWR